MPNDFKERIYNCTCQVCQKLIWLVETQGAVIQFSETRAGRLCEIAVVAATGKNGILEADVVNARRLYAKHLGIVLSGNTSNSNDPVHIKHAITDSNHNPDANRRINIGQAIAMYKNGRFTIL